MDDSISYLIKLLLPFHCAICHQLLGHLLKPTPFDFPSWLILFSSQPPWVLCYRGLHPTEVHSFQRVCSEQKAGCCSSNRAVFKPLGSTLIKGREPPALLHSLLESFCLVGMSHWTLIILLVVCINIFEDLRTNIAWDQDSLVYLQPQHIILNLQNSSRTVKRQILSRPLCPASSTNLYHFHTPVQLSRNLPHFFFPSVFLPKPLLYIILRP